MRSNLSPRLSLICALGLILPAVLSGCGGQPDSQPVQAPPEPVNNAPVIADLHADTAVVEPLGKSNIVCAASDPDGDELIYRWTTTGGMVDSTGAAVTWIAPADPGSYLITVVVSDGKGGATSQETAVMVPEKPNNPPVITAIKFMPAGRTIIMKRNPTDAEQKNYPPVIKRTDTAYFECVATDSDKDNLTYIWKASGGTLTGNGPKIFWRPPIDAANYTITCEVSDGKGGSDSFTITISVHCCSG
ncbi:MAG: PKD domain-containing protein [Dehalococcoidia bacterium]|nr:PKD domain-containing protein [Dehalococcoidia bacterium]